MSQRKLVRAGLLGPLLLFLSCALWLGAGAQSPQLRIYQIDVEQADAALLVAPNLSTLLIDTGLGNVSAQRIKALMNKLGLTKIDHLVISHYHSDHYGGVSNLVVSQGVNVVKAYDRGFKQFLGSKTNENDFVAYQTTLGFRAAPLKPGDRIDIDPTMIVTCIASSGAVSGEQNPVLNSDKAAENDNSVALLIDFAGFRYFSAGDIERHTETNIAAHVSALNVDACKASHHGAETSSSAEMMSDLQPAVIVISNGDHGGFHHPRQVILDRYEAMLPKPKVFQTNKYTKGPPGGNVPDEFIGDPETSDDDGTILLTVAPSTVQFFVTCGNKVTPFPIKNHAGSTLVIEALLPKPAGADAANEKVTLNNRGSVKISLAGWILRDETGKIWKLEAAGEINPGESKQIVRNNMLMSLKDSGDTVFLIAPDGTKKDEFHYAGSQQEMWISTGH